MIKRTFKRIRRAQARGELPLLTPEEVEGLATLYALDEKRDPEHQVAALRLVAEIQGLVGRTAVMLHGHLGQETERALSDHELDSMLAVEERKLPGAIDVTPKKAISADDSTEPGYEKEGV